MAKTIQVSYLVIGAYGTFIMFSTLMVGILPPLVNRPECNSNNDTNLIKENVVERAPREIQMPIEPININKRINDFKQEYSDFIAQMPEKFSRLLKSDGYNICPEVLNPNGQIYPWFYERLPDRYVPKHYNVELFVPEWGLNVYVGEMAIQVNIVTDSSSPNDKYIILHADKEIPILGSIKDKSGNELKVDCVAEYNQFKNEYFVIKLKDFIDIGASPLTIELLFLAILPEYDSGIFEFKFGKPGSES